MTKVCILLVLLTYVYYDARFRKRKIDFVVVKGKHICTNTQNCKASVSIENDAVPGYFVSSASAKRPTQLQRGLAAL